jgi:hypothetical protein
LSSSSSRDRLTTSELHPSRSPPRLFPRLLHRSAQFTSLGLLAPRSESIRSRQQLPLQAIYRFVVHGFSSYVSITRRDSQRSSSVRFPRVPSLGPRSDVLARRQPRSLSREVSSRSQASAQILSSSSSFSSLAGYPVPHPSHASSSFGLPRATGSTHLQVVSQAFS